MANPLQGKVQLEQMLVIVRPNRRDVNTISRRSDMGNHPPQSIPTVQKNVVLITKTTKRLKPSSSIQGRIKPKILCWQVFHLKRMHFTPRSASGISYHSIDRRQNLVSTLSRHIWREGLIAITNNRMLIQQ